MKKVEHYKIKIFFLMYKRLVKKNEIFGDINIEKISEM